MGIHNFQQFVKTIYSASCRKIWHYAYDNIYIDLNHILHRVAYECADEHEVIIKTQNYIANILTIAFPRKNIVIVADGIPPMGKLPLQRKRRMLSSHSSISVNFTPMSTFMTLLENNLTDFSVFLKTVYDVNVIYDLTNAGEGEIKIKNYVDIFQKQNCNFTHLIFSGDSDTILLLSLCETLDKLYVMISFDFVVSIGKMMDIHVSLYGKSLSYKYDFVFMNILMGNDYVPKMGIIQLKHIWNAYAKLLYVHSKWLIKINKKTRNIIMFNSEFFHDIILCALSNSRKKPLQIKLNDINSPMYINYIYGIAWCINMYDLGTCCDWTYMSDSSTTINPIGMIYSLLLKNKYEISIHKQINNSLYNALAMPYASRDLPNDSKIIQEQIKLKYSHFFDVSNNDRCIDIIRALTST